MALTSIYVFLLSTVCLMCLTNAVDIQFEMTDHQVVEGQGPCDAILSKAGKLEDDVVTRVRALTIGQFEDITGEIFSRDVPHASESDFNSSYEEMITFEANGEFRQRKRVEVSVIDDNIHEENEEFLLYFDVISRGNSDIITIGRNPLRCRIANNDDIKIGFESREYTVDEGSDLVSQVFITKLGGTSTEVNINLTISTTSLINAMQGVDFVTPSKDRVFDLTFPSGQNEIGLPIAIPANNKLDGSRQFLVQFTTNRVDGIISDQMSRFALITIVDTTLPSPSPSSSPAPSSTISSSTSLPSLPEPELTVINPVVTTVPSPTNQLQQTPDGSFSTSIVPQVTQVPRDNPECGEKEDKDLGLAIGLTFLLTFLLTAICAAIIIVCVVIADRRRRDKKHIQQLS